MIQSRLSLDSAKKQNEALSASKTAEALPEEKVSPRIAAMFG
jgi:hypothetical protein